MNLDRWMTDTVTHAAQAGVSSSGDPAFSSGVAIPARVQAGKDRDCAQIQHTDVLYTLTAVEVNDLIWLPDADTSDAKQARIAKHVENTSGIVDDTVLWKVLL